MSILFDVVRAITVASRFPVTMVTTDADRIPFRLTQVNAAGGPPGQTSSAALGRKAYGRSEGDQEG
jgi:hypothetical protein